MKQKYVPPRYIVRMPDKEVELDALEILEEFETRKINTTTMIRPVGGGDWTELRNTPEFIAPLAKCYKTQCKRIKHDSLGSWFIFMILLAVFPILPFFQIIFMPLEMMTLPIAIEIGLASWQNYYPFTFCMIYVITAIANLDHMLSRGLGKNTRPIPSFSMDILYWNSFEGYRRFKKYIEALPSEQRRFISILNPLVWVSLLAFLISTWFMPQNTEGGIIVYSLYIIFWILLGLTTFIFMRELKRRAVLWHQNNPPPEDNEVSSSPLLKAHKNKIWKNIVTVIVIGLPAALLAFVLLCAPYYIIGKIRMWHLEKITAELYIPLSAELYQQPSAPPHAAPELEKIDIPELPEKYYDLLGVNTIPENYDRKELVNDLQKIAPQLDKFRSVLRQYERLGIARDPENWQTIDSMHKKLHSYLYWRRMNSLVNPQANPMAQLDDLRRCKDYEVNEDPGWCIFSASRYSHLETRILSIILPELSNLQLKKIKARIREDEQAVSGIAQRYSFAEKILDTEMMISPFNVFIMFIDNIRATAIEDAIEQSKLLRQDYYQNSSDCKSFYYRIKRRGGIYFLSMMNDNVLDANIAVSRTRACYRMCLAAIAGEQYRRKYDKFPATLSELVPQYLQSVPVDPFDGKPLRYKQGKCIYSIDRDMIDDNGRRNIRHKGDSYDLVFPLKQ